MSKALNGEGSVKKVKSGKHAGKWRVQISYVLNNELVKVDKIRTELYGEGGAKELYDEHKEIAKAAAKGEDLVVQIAEKKAKVGLTVGQWFDWLCEHDWRDEICGKTALNRKARFEKFVRSRWGSVPLAAIDAMAVKGFYKELVQAADERLAKGEAKPGHAQILEMKRDLVRLYNLARMPYGRVPATIVNPFAVTLPKRGDGTATVQARAGIIVMPEDAKKAMLAKDLDTERRAFLALLMLGGVRLGEAQAITKGQLHFDEGLIHIDRAIHEENGRQWVGKPKKDKLRWVVMCPALAAILKAQVAGLADDELLFASTTDSRRWRTNKLTYATWRRIKKEAKLPAAMQTRDCRLSHNTWIEKLMLDVSKMTRYEHMGHAGEGVNEINYVRPLSPAQTVLRDAIEKVAGVKWLWETAA